MNRPAFHASNPINHIISAVAYPAYRSGNDAELDMTIDLLARMTDRDELDVWNDVLDAFDGYADPATATHRATEALTA